MTGQGSVPVLVSLVKRKPLCVRSSGEGKLRQGRRDDQRGSTDDQLAARDAELRHSEIIVSPRLLPQWCGRKRLPKSGRLWTLAPPVSPERAARSAGNPGSYLVPECERATPTHALSVPACVSLSALRRKRGVSAAMDGPGLGTP